VRAPGGCERRIAPGALCCRSGSPPIPAETGRKYSNYSLARLWLILAGPMASAINNLSALAQKRAEALRGCEAASALTTGGSGGCLWLAARIAQYRCESEWTHLIFAETSASTLTIGKVKPGANG
jgi:hypothetical protein